MPKKETAEQKLLRIIEEDSGESDSSQTAAAKPSDSQVSTTQEVQDIAASVKGSGVSMPPIFSMFMDQAKNLQLIFPSGKSFGLREVNMLLIVFIVCAIAIFGVVYVSETKRIANNLNFVKDTVTQSIASGVNIMPKYEDLTSFLKEVLTRNLFRPYEKKESEVVGDNFLGSQKIAAKMSALKLVGISWLDTPDSASVMIENDQGMTYFLREGESINQVTIQKIYADRAIFKFEDQEMEVRL